jgi:hypothetical protein
MARATLQYSWRTLIAPAVVLAAGPWLAGMLFAAFVGARSYMPGYLDFWQMWRAYAPSQHYRFLLELAAGIPIALAMAVVLWASIM